MALGDNSAVRLSGTRAEVDGAIQDPQHMPEKKARPTHKRFTKKDGQMSILMQLKTIQKFFSDQGKIFHWLIFLPNRTKEIL